MAGIFQGLADWIFGVDPIDASREREQESYLIGQSHDYAVREQQDYQRQLQLTKELEARIAGKGGPSVAQQQLQIGADQINRDAASRAAGGTGSNAALSSYGALLTQADTASRLNQQQALLRAQETQANIGQLGAMNANMGRSSMMGYGNALGAGVQYGNMAMQAQQANQRAQAASVGTLLSTLGAIGGTAVGGPAGGVLGSQAGQTMVPAQSPGAAYSAAMPGYAASNANYGTALAPTDYPQDPYQASNYGSGLYSPSPSVGQR